MHEEERIAIRWLGREPLGLEKYFMEIKETHTCHKKVKTFEWL